MMRIRTYLIITVFVALLLWFYSTFGLLLTISLVAGFCFGYIMA